MLRAQERNQLLEKHPESAKFLRRYIGSQEISKGIVRYSLLIDDDEVDEALAIPEIAVKVQKVRDARLNSTKVSTREKLSMTPHKYELVSSTGDSACVAVARTTSETRDFLATELLEKGTIANDNAFFAEQDQLLIFSILVSSLHLTWIATICGRMKNDYRYANTLGWNTFPIPKLTEKNRRDLTSAAEGVLLARQAHFPETIAKLYEVKEGVAQMPGDLVEAHRRNDEVLERIYIGRHFRNDTERMEKLFELYTKMTTKVGAA